MSFFHPVKGQNGLEPDKIAKLRFVVDFWTCVGPLAVLRDRSKFTGYLGRVLGKICLKKSLRPPLSFLLKTALPKVMKTTQCICCM